MTEDNTPDNKAYLYRRELRPTHAEYLGKEVYFEEYTKTGLPWTQDIYEYDRYWIPKWLSAIRTRLGWIVQAKNEDTWKHLLASGFECLKEIYDDEALRAKYSTLYTLDPDYNFTKDFKTDLEHLDCFKKLVGP